MSLTPGSPALAGTRQGTTTAGGGANTPQAMSLGPTRIQLAPNGAPMRVAPSITPVTRLATAGANDTARSNTPSFTSPVLMSAARGAAPASAVSTEPKPTVNKDGSQTFRHRDADGRVVGTTVVTANGQVLQNYQRDASGRSVLADARAGVKVTRDPSTQVTRSDYASGLTRTERPEGDRRVLQEVRPNGIPYRSYSQPQPMGSSVVYVTQPNQGIFDNPFFWL